MKYMVFIAAAVFFLSCANSDKQANGDHNRDSLAQVALQDSANFTDLQWIDSVNQDLGKVNAGQMVDITWHVKNTGSKPLVIANVSPGCGCTVADRPKEPIAPGGEGVIRAKFDSKGQSPGTHTKNVTVTANTKQQAYILTFKVDVVP
jgi:hypothetical protein